MTHVEIRAWFDANAARKLAEFGLPHWRIEIQYEVIEDGKMSCSSLPERERAWITVNVVEYQADADATKLEEDFEHEMMHVVHAPFELVRDVVLEHLGNPSDSTAYKAFQAHWCHACEMTVRNMERMRYGLRKAAKPIPASSVKESDEGQDPHE